jgi:hypothetical protein
MAVQQNNHRGRWRWTIRSKWRCAASAIRRCAWPSPSSRPTTGGQPRRRRLRVGRQHRRADGVARYVLKTLEGIDRPAIASCCPTRDGFTTVLDLGANVDCTPEHLLQFAVMGSALVSGGRRQGRAQRRACSTSARRPSRAARPSSAPANCCAPPPRPGRSTSTATSRATTSSRAPPTWWSATASSATWRSRPAEGLAGMLTRFIRQEFTRNAADQAGGAGGHAGAQALQGARRPPPLQRRGAAGPARIGVQEPRLGGRLRLRAGPAGV